MPICQVVASAVGVAHVWDASRIVYVQALGFFCL
jgi:hypothetical protein